MLPAIVAAAAVAMSVATFGCAASPTPGVEGVRSTEPAPSAAASSAVQASPVSDVLSAPYADEAGTASTYHLFTSAVRARPAVGVVVYLDGDGMFGHDHPTSAWALGGPRGIVAQAGARGYATLSIRTPDQAGALTFWEEGPRNAAYVDSLIAATSAQLRTTRVWLVGYSGGSVLITKDLLPRYGDRFISGGAVITGGGGAPTPATPVQFPATMRDRFPLYWYVGSKDDGSTAEDGYDALADARGGSTWYLARGFRSRLVVATGLDHEDLGTRFGSVLAAQLDAQCEDR